MRTRAFAPLLAVAVALAAPSIAAADPPKVRVKTTKTVVRATLGSNCWPSNDGATHVCADAAYPLKTEGVLPWRARAPFVVGLSEPVDGDFSICLARVADGREVPLDRCLAIERGADGKWRGRLPKNLGGANRLWIQIFGPGYDAQYSAAIAP